MADIIITVKGGIVESVFTSAPEKTAAILDYDAMERAEGEELEYYEKLEQELETNINKYTKIA